MDHEFLWFCSREWVWIKCVHCNDELLLVFMKTYCQFDYIEDLDTTYCLRQFLQLSVGLDMDESIILQNSR